MNRHIRIISALGMFILMPARPVAAEISGVYVRAQLPQLHIETVKVFPTAGRAADINLRFIEYRGRIGDALLEVREGDVVMREPATPSAKVERLTEWSKAPYRGTVAITSYAKDWVVALMIDRVPEGISEKRSPGIYLSLAGSDRKRLVDQLRTLLSGLEISLDGVSFVGISQTGLMSELEEIINNVRK